MRGIVVGIRRMRAQTKTDINNAAIAKMTAA